MPRRGTELIQLPLPAKKKVKTVEEPMSVCPSLDVSFCDDEGLPPGIIFTDVKQKQWRIGKPIGRGSFGRIYLASDEVDKEVTKLSSRYVVKIEPHSNGPLFVEIHCLIRTAQASKVKSWRIQNKQKRLGMPVYIASGSFTDENTGIKYRFLVLPRYDIDLYKIISRTKVLDLKNVLILAVQILHVLEFLHSEGYTHSDIKSSNLMLGYDGMKIGKLPIVRLNPSFQKDCKDIVFSPKHRRPKTSKTRTSNYYDDEDFVVKDYKSPSNSDSGNEPDKRLATVKKKLRKILSDKDHRNLHRHHAFNLRQLSNYVNYEDLNSSICSDNSYQRLLDDFGNKNMIKTTKEFQESKKKSAREAIDSKIDLDDNRKEAIMSQSTGQIYLLDYGLASKFLDADGKHKDYSMDLRKAHDGTLEYSSRDSHIGAHSRRSDLETLGFNLLDWLTGTLPWKTTEVLAEPDLVHALKKNFMGDIKLLLRTCFKTEFYPQFMEKYLEYVSSLDFAEKPDYEYCRNLFRTELTKTGCGPEKELNVNFVEPAMSPMSRNKLYYKRFGRKNTPPNFKTMNGIKKACERENVCSPETDLKLELLKQTLNSSSDGIRRPCTSRNFFVSDADLVARLKKSLMPHGVFGKKLSPKNLRSQKKVQKRKGVRRHRNSIGKFGNFMGSARQFTWAEILAGNPEDIIRKERKEVQINDDDDNDSDCKYRIRKLSNASSEASDSNVQSPLLQKDYLLSMNPTYAMKEVIATLKKKASGKTVNKDLDGDLEGLEGYTPAMIKVYRMKQKREEKERLEAAKLSCPMKETEKRCTRSMRGKQEKISEPTKRTTRKKGSVDCDKSTSVELETPKVEVPKTNNRTRSKSKVANKYEAQEEGKPVEVPAKKIIRKRSITVVNNRRKLRSSCRNK